MEKQKLMLVFLVSGLYLMLLVAGNIQVAYALTVHNVALAISPDVIDYIDGLDRYIAVDAGVVNIIQPTNYVVETSYTLSAGISDTSCDGSVCYGIINGGADNEQFIFGFNPLTGATIYNATFNFGSGAYSAIDDMAGGTNSMITFNGRTYAYAICDNGDRVMVVAEGNNPVGMVGDCAGAEMGTGSSLGMVAYGNKIAITTDSPSADAFQIWFLSGGLVCNGAVQTFVSAGHLAYSSTTGKIYKTTDSSQRVDIMNASTCADEGDITSAQSGLTTTLRGIQVNDDREEIYIQSTTTVAVMDLNSPTTLLYSFAVGDTSTPRDKTTVSTEYAQYATSYSSTFRIVQLGDLPDNGGGNSVDGVCGVGTALDCVGDRSTINQITGAQNFTTVIGDLGTQLGIMNTTANTDPETNGSGLLLMLITGTFFASVVISSIAVANNKFGANIQYTEIPKEFWLFLVIGVVALAWYLNWIPDIVFYGMIVGLAGLFAFGLYRQFNGKGG